MSKGKGPKKPLSKATVALLEQLRRLHGVRDLPERFLVVCEDGKSAPNYFEALKKHFNLSATSIMVVGGGGRTQPTQIVSRAIEIKQNATDAESGTEPFNHVWCVIDGDYGAKINNARAMAKANGVELAISTMCVEYWVLLHFEHSSSPTVDCDALVHCLRTRHLTQYEKGSCDFRTIVEQVHGACNRAEKSRRPGIARGDHPENQNPCTEVYKLIKAILDS
jgi:hypothetical protein